VVVVIVLRFWPKNLGCWNEHALLTPSTSRDTEFPREMLTNATLPSPLFVPQHLYHEDFLSMLQKASYTSVFTAFLQL
jgi:hypothetical protein